MQIVKDKLARPEWVWRVGRGLLAAASGITIALALGSAPLRAADAIQVPEPPAERADDDARPATVGPKNLFEIIRQGGLIMGPLVLCSFVTLVFVFERAIALRRGRVIPAPFVKRFLVQLKEGKLDRDQALELCGESQSPVAEVFAAAARKWGRASVEIEQAMIDAGERVAHGLRKYLRLFNAVAQMSPMLGLLGTVFGIIHLFNDVATSDAMGRTELLAAGISEALLTTASGLSVAIPALCIYMFFVSRVDRLLVDMDNLGQEVVAVISAEAIQDAKAARSKNRAAAA
ncbi:MAG TPA: MotA/TolQ/ExbB proton channel family protein [Pirellulales bacterium]|nr:MotA/TolQ/ExbB proton channel family protein [Pirellulales bacterium]